MDICSIDVSGIEGTTSYCSPSAADEVRGLVARTPLSAVHDIGDGNHHYISLFYLERICEPFALVLFDHHPDNQDGAFDAGLLSCGNWVKQAESALPLLKDAVRAGGPEPFRLPSDGLPVYISIDLDILSERYIKTVWDQGDMSPEELFSHLGNVLHGRRLLGVDICGSSDGSEKVVADLHSFFASRQSSPAE